MQQTRILCFATLVFAAVAPISSFAQAQLPPPPFDAQAAVLSDPNIPPPVSAHVPLAAEPALDDGADKLAERAVYKTPRKRIADFAMSLRDIRYRRAGHDPSTGFDCSGFTHYVYSKTYGLDLPYDAPSQFRRGDRVARADLKVGDLVFFGVRGRITHVGIYMGDGRFIHSPSSGKRVRVDQLAGAYWGERYAGARRMF